MIATERSKEKPTVPQTRRREGGTTMHDSFSEGGVFYGRSLAILAGIVALAVVLGQIL
jgi:hypothetical protein